MENIMTMLEFAVFSLVCFTLAMALKIYKSRILQYTTDLIDRAEAAIKGSGMGEAKKALVIAQLEAAGIRVTTWLDKQIDIIVATLNANGAWLAAQTKQHISGLGGALDGIEIVATPHILHNPIKVNDNE